jgi:hypothetical protein
MKTPPRIIGAYKNENNGKEYGNEKYITVNHLQAHSQAIYIRVNL